MEDPARFRTRETDRLLASGWVALDPLRRRLEAAGVDAAALVAGLTADDWARASEAAALLRERFSDLRFAGDVEYGLLLVPGPSVLDTRTPVAPEIRQAQRPQFRDDVADPALGPGVDLVGNRPATLFVTVVGRVGAAAGSHADVVAAPAAAFLVDGFDTRRAMTRQLWGARVLQAGTGVLPDSDENDPWTFTLLPGEGLVAGRAVSGTVLKGRVRFRLGRPDRGIGSARIAPAVPLRPAAYT